MKNLKFRRQFLLAPRQVEALSAWPVRVCREGWLYTHPELPLHEHVGAGRRVWLAGFVVDAVHPERNTGEILAELLRELQAGASLGTLTLSLGGRWVMFIEDARELVLLNDPCGMRRIFYYSANGSREFWCGSDPKIFEHFAGAQRDEALLSEFRKAGVFEDREYWWPAPLTGYVGARRLAPNHCLSLPQGVVRRYWPESPRPNWSLETCVEQLGRTLASQVRGMAGRERLAMTLTAGLDTRTILAACKGELGSAAWFHSWLLPALTDTSPDIALPRQMLQRYGLTLHVLPCNGKAEPEFAAIYDANCAFSHAYWKDIAQGLLLHYPQDRLSIKGNCSEAGRCYYYHYGYPRTAITAEFITSKERGWGQSPAIVQAVSNWLADAREAERTTGYRVLDLLHWEQRLGGCQANSQAEWDIAQEVFCPFNNRQALIAMLAGPEDQRLKDGVHRALIESCCPELLELPVNPKPLRKRISRWIKRQVKVTAQSLSRPNTSCASNS